jgi:hypothetical protein
VTVDVLLSYPMHRRSRNTGTKKLCGGVTVRIDVAIGLACFSRLFGTMQPSLTVGMQGNDGMEPNARSIDRTARPPQLSAKFLHLRFDTPENVKPVTFEPSFR